MAITGLTSFNDRVRRSAGAIGVALVLFASGCHLERGGVGSPSNNVKLFVDPELACPGDRVGVRWDMTTTLPRVAENCLRCRSRSTCSEGFQCLDGVCCRDPELSGGAACNVGGACLPSSIVMTITSDPAMTIPALPRPLPLRGGISVPVSTDTDMIAGGRIAFPFEGIRDRARVLVAVDPNDKIPMVFPFACASRGFEWTPYDFRMGPSTSDNIRVEGIRNTGRHAVLVTGGVPRRDGIRIEPGGTTAAFDGSPARGVWFAFIPPGAGVEVPICSPSEVINALPDITLAMRVVCRSTP
jgi:hypothetical protein